MQKNKKIKICLSSSTSLILAIATLVTIRTTKFNNLEYAQKLNHLQTIQLQETLKQNFPEKNSILHELSFSNTIPKLPVKAESAILIDTNTGDILYEKNADQVIPPASMTKLFAMYVVDQEVASGKLSYNQIIPIPEEALACNMPPHSSLMFLGEGHIVSLNELLLGLSICSGNDAAYALAYTVSGSMEGFIERMNQVAKDLGLTHTHFVESSGYSELNTTTAREMAAFCRIYLSEHPDSLKRFHAISSFTYPKEHNLAPGDLYHSQDWSNGLPRHITMGITQANTNPLLGKLEGCDGLKTGYIDESGYNLALTAKRGDTRFLSVTMKGPGKNSKEGQQGRISDGKTLMEYAFSNFADYINPELNKNYFVKCYGSKEMSFYAVPSFKINAICIPFILPEEVKENTVNNVHLKVECPEKIYGPVKVGQQIGKITVYLSNFIIEEIPLVADRTTNYTNPIFRLADKLSSML